MDVLGDRQHRYLVLAAAVLLIHALFIAWIIFGALLTRSHPRLWRLHLASLLWGILIEVFPWTCPLTYLENLLESRAGVAPYEGGFLLHYLDKLVYPDVSPISLVVAGVLICAANLAFYSQQALAARGKK